MTNPSRDQSTFQWSRIKLFYLMISKIKNSHRAIFIFDRNPLKRCFYKKITISVSKCYVLKTNNGIIFRVYVLAKRTWSKVDVGRLESWRELTDSWTRCRRFVLTSCKLGNEWIHISRLSQWHKFTILNHFC